MTGKIKKALLTTAVAAEILMTDKIKKTLFTTAVAAMTFGGGYGLAKHNAKIEKEQLKAKTETIFDKQITSNNNRLPVIQAERNELHDFAQKIIISAIKEQNKTSSKQLNAFYQKAIKSFTKKEIEQLNEEWRNCGGRYDIWYSDLIVKWAINITGNKNTALEFSPNTENDLIDAPIKYKELGAKRRALRKEFDNIHFIYADGNEQEFIKSIFAHTDNKDTVKLYSYILQDFIKYYNEKNNDIEYWKEEYVSDTDGSSYDASDYETRTGHIYDVPGGYVPNFGLTALKKHQKELDKICSRLQELEKQEKQLLQTQELKNAVIANFSR